MPMHRDEALALMREWVRDELKITYWDERDGRKALKAANVYSIILEQPYTCTRQKWTDGRSVWVVKEDDHVNGV